MVINQRLKQHFTDLNGSYSGTVNGTIADYLVSEGYSGNINNMLQDYLSDLGYGTRLSGSFPAYLEALSSTLYPNLQASYKFTDSLKDLMGNGAATLTRASSATYLDPDTGLITTVSSNQPRFEEQGLLIEEARTNLVTYSVNSAQWGAAAGVTVTSTNNTAPDGTSTATELEVTDVSVAAFKGPLFTPADTSAHAISVYVKGVGSSIGKVLDLVVIDAVTSTPNGTVATTTLTSDFQRVEVTITPATTNLHYVVAGHLTGASSTLEVGDSFQIWGYQAEDGTGASSYIPTAGSTATRAKDVLSVPNTCIPARTAGMSLRMTFQTKSDPGGYHGLWSTTGEVYREGYINNSTEKLEHSMPATDASTGTAIAHGTSYVYGFTYDADGNWIAYIDGTQDDTAAVGSISGTTTNTYIGATDSATYVLHGWLKDVRVYDRVLTAQEIARA